MTACGVLGGVGVRVPVGASGHFGLRDDGAGCVVEGPQLEEALEELPAANQVADPDGD